ncbi:MAG: DeoR/GlpR transcriptional regulator [Lachnospiraceae bacterium]|jgi:DeoR/GlpR family transcriptional regulator of sugar metabolism|nr:DeoR/GlpR transcriptional regulator [Lachnospiraceae bacterium]MCI8996541.1 DeoR/GlpR transcriptional regulator [Lachnospiraceae bacterium]MCI9134332.1 DeoR/GlpR transcriptional regulator [Lachnospiraceae bacterium]
MKYQEREQRILEILGDQQTIRAAELSQLLGVSVVTVRKDLQQMEDEGKLIRTFGGASARRDMRGKDERLEILHRISDYTEREIQDGESLIMNAGTTTLLLAQKLQWGKRLKVLTNSVYAAGELSGRDEIQLILLGGKMSSDAVFTSGRDTIEQLEQYKVDKLILSVNGISCTKGLTTRHVDTADLYRKMIERAKEVIVVADESKVGMESFYYVCGLEVVTKIITNDSKSSQNSLEQMRKLGIQVCVC